MSSSPSAILANKQQLDDLLAFCCRSNYFDVLGVDATFELGDICDRLCEKGPYPAI